MGGDVKENASRGLIGGCSESQVTSRGAGAAHRLIASGQIARGGGTTFTCKYGPPNSSKIKFD